MSSTQPSLKKSQQNQKLKNALSSVTDSELEAKVAKNNYKFYLEYVHAAQYIPARHIDYMCSVLERVEAGELRRVMFFLPPQHSKSMTVSETFPSWYIGRNPTRAVIQTSYGDRLARRFGRRNKEKLEALGDSIFGVDISSENASVTNWSVRGERGGMISAGIGGPITGEGASLLVIDDPIKNRQEADSAVYRESIWDEWQNTLLTRLSPNGAVIIICTRWHEDDLAGRLLRQQEEEAGQEPWEVVNLPCIAENEDQLGRPKGEPLWPGYGFDLEWSKIKKSDIGSRAWAALYQQRPAPEEGSIIKSAWLQYYDPMYLPVVDEMIQSWDCAFKDIGNAAYVCGQVWARCGVDYYLVDQIREHLDFTSTISAIKSMTSKYPQAHAKLIEEAANGHAVLSMLRKQIHGLIPFNPRDSKEGRLHAVSPVMESGNVYVPRPDKAPWATDYIKEMVLFPHSENSDQVDSTTQALLHFLRYRHSTRTHKKKPAGW